MNKFYFVLAFAIGVIALAACKKNELVMQSSCVTEEESPYEFVGRMHNDGLDYILKQIKEGKNSWTKSGRAVSKADYELIVSDAVKDYVSLNFNSDFNSQYTKSVFDDNKNSEICLGSKGFKYYEKMLDVFNACANPDEVSNSLNTIECQISSDISLDGDSRERLRYMNALAQASLLYWDREIQEWYFTLNYETEIDSDTKTVNRVIITGNVVDEFGGPASCVIVSVVGTSVGVQTDADGCFSIKAEPGSKLKFSLIGCRDRIIKVSDFLSGKIKTVVMLPDSGEGWRVIGKIALSDAIPAVIGGVACVIPGGEIIGVPLLKESLGVSAGTALSNVCDYVVN